MNQMIKDRYSKLRGEPFPDYAEKIPEVAFETLLNYVEFGVEPGDFMEAFLSNDLFDAVARADKEMLLAFRELFWFIYNRLPSGCHGSREKVREWRRARREQISRQFAGIIDSSPA